jgi:uncharacterized low-complexity protein
MISIKTECNKLLVGSLLAFALMAFSGCSDSASAGANEKTMKCGEGKCGGDKKDEAMKCGEGKCGKDKKTMKCGEGKCGGDKK